MREHDSADARDRTTSMMCIALVAGLLVGARMAYSSYRSRRRHRDHDDQVKRWESEGGAIGGAASTPPAH